MKFKEVAFAILGCLLCGTIGFGIANVCDRVGAWDDYHNTEIEQEQDENENGDNTPVEMNNGQAVIRIV